MLGYDKNKDYMHWGDTDYNFGTFVTDYLHKHFVINTIPLGGQFK